MSCAQEMGASGGGAEGGGEVLVAPLSVQPTRKATAGQALRRFWRRTAPPGPRPPAPACPTRHCEAPHIFQSVKGEAAPRPVVEMCLDVVVWYIDVQDWDRECRYLH